MSSHHFVTEGQEPALLINTSDINQFHLFDQLAGWNPVIIAFEKAMPSLILNTVQVDHLLSSDIMAWSEISAERNDLHIHKCSEKDWLNVVLRILQDASCRHIQLLTDTPDFDSWDFITPQIGLTVFTPAAMWIHSESGKFHRWLPAGSILNVVHNEMNGVMDESVLKIEKDGIVSFDYGKPIWVGQAL